MRYRRSIAYTVLVCACFGAAGELLVLENDSIRVEFDAALFSIRYVGRPGGDNFVAPLHVSERLRSTKNVSPGGISLHAVISGAEKIIAPGPAEVVEQTRERLVVLGPPLGKTQVRLRLEVVLTPGAPETMFSVTAQTADQQSHRISLSSNTHLAPATGLRLFKSDVTIRPPSPGSDLLIDAGDYWEFPMMPGPVGDVPGEAKNSAMVEGAAAVMAFHLPAVEWVRHLGALQHEGDEDVTPRLLIRYETDPRLRLRTIDVEGPAAEVDLWNQPVLREMWRLQSAGEEAGLWTND
jgi:hypothetical protein